MKIIAKRRLLAAAAIALAGSFALSACSSSSSQSGSATTTITAAVAYSSRDFHPSSTSGALPLAANWHVTEPLYAIDYSDYSVFNALAADEPEEVSDTEYVVTIRDGAMFSDGTAVTADDVVSSYERTTAEGSLYISMLDFIDRVEATADNQVTFYLNQAFPMFKERLALIQIVPSSATDEDLTSMPIGSGPWKYVEITDEQVVFERNDLYNGDYPAAADQMVWNVIVDDTARVTAMQAGEADVMEMVPAEAFDLLESSGAELQTVQGFNTAFIMFNTQQEPFDDARVRQAVFYAIDVEALVENNMSGQAEAATSFLSSNSDYYNEASNVYTQDLDKARELLEEAGVTEPLSFTLYTTDHSWISSLAPQIKENLEELGWEVSIESMASSSLYSNITDIEDADYSMVLAPGDPSVFGNDPDLLMNWWYGDNSWTQTRTFWKDSDGYNQLHELMDAALAADTDEERQEYWNQCFDLLSEELPLYPLLHRTTTTAVKEGTFSNFGAIGTTGLNLVKAELTS